MRKLLALGVVLVVLVVADSAARAIAADRMSGSLAASFHLSEEPRVDIGGFPFLWGFARGELDSLSLTVEELGTDAIALDRVEATLHGISFSPAEALSGELGRVEIRGGRGSARLSSGRVEEALRAAGGSIGNVTLDQLPDPSIRGRTLTVGPADLLLPVLTEGMSYESARVVSGTIRLGFRMGPATLRPR